MAKGSNLERENAAVVLARARGNKLRRYPSPDTDGDRLYPLASPASAPSFRIGPDETIFAIGSCFARNIERALTKAGKRVLSRDFDLGQIGESLGQASNFFNKYTIFSVVNELRWSLDRETFPAEALFYPLKDDKFCDCQLGVAKLDFEIDQVLEFRHRYLDAMAQVETADVIVLTLGYVETWFDTNLGLYLNVAPPVQLIKASPERFEFRVLSYHDVLRGLNDLYALLTQHRSKPLKMLITVSPVPLNATFRDMDVLVANAYSKSVQRAAIDEFVSGKDGVDYFPSYEFVALSNPAVAWARDDYRHVSSHLVNRIMSDVLAAYCADPDQTDPKMTADALASSVLMMLKLENTDDALSLIDRHRALADSNAAVLMAEAAALRQANRLDDAWAALSRAVELAPRRPGPLEALILLCAPLNRSDATPSLLSDHAGRFPGRKKFRNGVDNH